MNASNNSVEFVSGVSQAALALLGPSKPLTASGLNLPGIICDHLASLADGSVLPQVPTLILQTYPHGIPELDSPLSD